MVTVTLFFCNVTSLVGMARTSGRASLRHDLSRCVPSFSVMISPVLPNYPLSKVQFQSVLYSSYPISNIVHGFSNVYVILTIISSQNHGPLKLQQNNLRPSPKKCVLPLSCSTSQVFFVAPPARLDSLHNPQCGLFFRSAPALLK